MRLNKTGEFLPRWPFLAVVKKDLLQQFRGGRLFLWVGLAIAMASLMVLLRWPTEGFYLREGAEASRAIFSVLRLIWFSSCLLLVPAYSAASILTEREDRVYEMTSITLVSHWGYALAKALGSLSPLFLIMVASLPILGTVFFLAGFDGYTVSWIVMLALSCALTCAVAGTFCSARFKDTPQAIAAAYVFAPLCLIVQAILTGLAFFVIMVVSKRLLAEPPASVVILSLLPTVALALAAIFTFFTAQELRNTAASSPEHPDSDHAPVPMPPQGRHHQETSPSSKQDNPFVVTEEFRHQYSWAAHENEAGVAVAFLLFAVVVFLLPFMSLGLAPALRGVMVFLLVPAFLLPGLLMSTLASRERDPAILDALRATLLNPNDLLLGKTHGIARRCRRPFAILATTCGVFALLGLVPAWTLSISWALSLLACVWVSLVLGFAVSVRARRVSTAVALTCMLLLIVGLLPLPAGHLLGWTADSLISIVAPGSRTQIADQLGQLGLALSPTTGFYHNLFSRHGGYLLTPYLLKNLTVCMLWSCAVLWLSMRRLRRLWERGAE